MRGDTKCGIVFLNKNGKLISGIALKRTSFLRDHDFFEAIKISDKYHKFILIDYEGRKNLLKIGQLNSLLKQIQNILIFTIAVRGVEFHENNGILFENYLQLMKKYDNFSFCVVAGHPAYRESIDTGISTNKSFNDFVGRIREHVTTPILLGAENLSLKIINNLKNKFDPIIPIILHGDSRLFRGNRLKGSSAVYSPISYKIPDNVAIRSLVGYLLRRKLTQSRIKNNDFSYLELSYSWDKLPTNAQEILFQCYQQCTLTSANVKEKTQLFAKHGIRLIFGNPINSKNSIELIKGFSLNNNE